MMSIIAGRRTRLTILFLIMVLIGLVGTLFVYYLFTRQPLYQIPGVQAVTNRIPPIYMTSIGGVQAPMGIAVANGRIYVAEWGGERLVRMFDSSGAAVGSLASPDTVPGSRHPAYIAVDNEGRVYVSDTRLDTIDIFSPEGEYLSSVFPDGDPHYDWRPVGVTFGPDGLLYVTDHTLEKHRVLALDPNQNWKVVLEFGSMGSGEGEFAYPHGIAVADDRIFVADGNNNRVQTFDKQGKYLGTIKGAFSLPRGLLLDGLGRLHVVETTGGQVAVHDVARDEQLFVFSLEGIAGGQSAFPSGGIASDEQGRLYITDRVNNRVQVWTY